MERNINEQKNSFKKSKINGNEIPLPTNEHLEKIIFGLPISFPSAMMPARIPELHYKMKNRQYPNYFYFSILALGNRLCSDVITEEDKNLESLYRKESLELLKQEKDIRNPIYLWTCVILLAHYGQLSDYLPYETLQNGNEIPLPTNEHLEKIIFGLPISFPSAMMPARIPELHYKMKNRQYPNYFYFSILALGNRLCSDVITEEDKNLESLYRKESLELLKQEKDIRNPIYLWTCVILLAHYGQLSDYLPYETLQIMASSSVRISRIYQIDLSKIVKMKYTEEELEFRRRVFWSFYIYNRLAMSFTGAFPTIQDRDIVVNLPKNDFLWRYGGECKLEHREILFWNYIANNLDISEHPKEKHKDLVKTILLYGKVNLFARKRWVTKVYDPDDDNLQLVRLINNLSNYSENIVTPNPINFEKIKEVHEKYENTLRMTIETEIQVLNYIFNQMHNSMKIVLYQTEMVRIKGRYMHPGRVVSAKNIITECAEKQIDLFHNFNKVLPPNHSEIIASPSTLVSGVVCLNLMGINPNGRKFDVPLKLKLLTDEYKKKSSQSVMYLLYPTFLNQLSKLIGKAHTENKKYSVVFDNMKKFSIDESDVNPWLIPKYSSYFTILCCFGNSFSTLKINEYLDIDQTTVGSYTLLSNPSIESDTTNIGSGEDYLDFLIDEDYTADISTSLTKTNTRESYKTNYEIYTHYSQLLEKSPPSSVHNYFFRRMVDIYSTRTVNDILDNPVNNQNNIGASFNIPSINLNFNTFGTQFEEEEDQEINFYDLPYMKMFDVAKTFT
ncbi:hypothetical protein BB558_001801 [Smittium angustum]|uniref:Xylanolytic transcriptional activator regulatory domain-containing protein n=1 Tax=Smittium angustum TaxID=133377 RepID=A0A2U1JAK7_SMIAN|nr:hypothetical protein BB558_001801 [Smittium angustum]